MKVAIAGVLISCFMLTCGQALAQKTTISFAAWFITEPCGRRMQECGKKYEARHPDVRIKFLGETYKAYWDKIQLQFASGTAADITCIDTSLIPMYNAMREGGAFANLDNYIKGTKYENLKLVNFCKSKITSGYYVGIPVFWLPFPQIIYRKDWFEEAGLHASDVDNWEDWISVAEKLTQDIDGDGVIDRFGMGLTDALEQVMRWNLVPLMYTVGGGFFKNGEPPYTAERLAFNSEPNQYAMRMLNELHEFCPPGSQDHHELYHIFVSGRIGMFYQAPSSAAKARQELPKGTVDVFPIPGTVWKGKYYGPVIPVTGGVMVMHRFSEHKEQAWEFMKALVGPEYQKEMAKTNPSPNSEVTESPWFREQSPLLYKCIRFAEMSKWVLPNPPIEIWREMDKAIWRGMQAIYQGKKSVKEALDDTQEELVKIMQR